MDLDIDDAIGPLPRWELILTVDGMTRATRAPSTGQFGIILRTLKNPIEADLVEAIVPLFDGDAKQIREWVGKWRLEKMLAVVQAVCAYFKDYLGKNSLPITEKVATAMGITLEKPSSSKSGTSGSSTRP